MKISLGNTIAVFVLLLSANALSDVSSYDKRQSQVNFRLNGAIKKIIDGDTVTLVGKNNKRFVIRLADLDTPETSHEAFTPRGCKKCETVPARVGQPGGKAATQALKKLIGIGDSVTAECYEIGVYGRMICHLFKGQKNINLAMIKNGWGWLPRNRQGKLNRAWINDPASYDAERVAKQNALGAWGLPAQISPRQWRTDCWDDGNCEGAEE